MPEKKLRYQPTDARRPDLIIQGEQLLTLIDVVFNEVRHRNFTTTHASLVEASCEGLENYQGTGDPLLIALKHMKLAVVQLETVERQTWLTTIWDFVPTVGNIQLHSLHEQDEVLLQAGVKPRGIGASQNPVAKAVKRIRVIDINVKKFHTITNLEWLGEIAEVKPEGTFKEWPAKVERQGRLGGPQIERLAWGLVLVESQRHLGLVWRIIHRMSKSYPKHTENDLFGWGWHGLCLALKSYSPATAAFSTYAARRINGTIRDGVRTEHHLPKRLTATVREIQVAEEELTQGMGRSPSLDELSSHVGATLVELELARTRYQAPASIDELMSRTTADTGHDRSWELHSEDDPALSAINVIRANAVSEALKRLPEEQRIAVQLLVLDGLAPREASEMTFMSTRQLRRAREAGLAAMTQDVAQWAT